MKKITFIFTLSLFVFCSCQNQPQTQVAEEIIVFELPEGAIPMTYINHTIYLELAFDTIKGNYILDTGADQLYHDSTFYADNSFLKNKYLYMTSIGGAGTQVRTVQVLPDTVNFSLHDNEYQSLFTPILDLKRVLGDYADGIMGAQFFKQSVLEVNYENEYIKIYEAIDSVDITSHEKIALSEKANRFYLPLEIKINDSLSVSGTFLLDLGATANVFFTSHIAKQNSFESQVGYKIAYHANSIGIGGSSSFYDFKSDSVRIGNFTLANVVTAYSTDRSGALAEGNYLGILGNSILDRFDIIIDFINNDLYLKPNTRFEEPFTYLRRGFGYVNRSKTKGVWVIDGFYENSNAEQAGLKMNDEIIKVNGIDVTTVKLKEEGKLLYQSDSLELTLRLDDSLTKTIKFKLDDRPNP